MAQKKAVRKQPEKKARIPLKLKTETDRDFVLRLFNLFATHAYEKPALLEALQARLEEIPIGREQESWLSTLDNASARMLAVSKDLRLEVKPPRE
jgi:hypothetical protein